MARRPAAIALCTSPTTSSTYEAPSTSTPSVYEFTRVTLHRVDMLRENREHPTTSAAITPVAMSAVRQGDGLFSMPTIGALDVPSTSVPMRYLFICPPVPI